jgi:low molecular weight protein-tyrosine phosphatase
MVQAPEVTSGVAARPDDLSAKDQGASLVPRILFLCTANRCRSPLAEQIMRRILHEQGLRALISSAGLLQGGFRTPPTGIAVALSNGLDLSRHRSVQVSTRLIEVSDVILTMSRAHAREIVALNPESWPRVYPLKQFTQLLSSASLPRRSYLRDATTLLGETRKRSSILGNPLADTVRDPMGTPHDVWQAVIDDIREQLQLVAVALAPLMAK